MRLLGAMFGMYRTLWAHERLLGYWNEVVRSSDYACLGMYALRVFESAFHFLYAVFYSLSLRAWCGCIMDCGMLERLWGVGHSAGIA